MDHRRARAQADLDRAADVAGGDDVGLQPAQLSRLAFADAARDLGLGDVVDPGRSAAEVRVGGDADGEAGGLQQALRPIADPLAMLERTGGMVGHRQRAFSDAASAIYRFVWNVFCDQYVELAKPILNGEDAAARAETRAAGAA